MAGVSSTNPRLDILPQVLTALNGLSCQTFTSLPVEAWQIIVDYLDVEDAVCLSLCTKDIHNHIGKQAHVLGRLIFEDGPRYQFLKWLRRDTSPYLMLCEYCLFLHPVPPRSYRPNGRKCYTIEESEKCEFYLSSGFGFGNVQVAAELYRRNRLDDLERYLCHIGVQEMHSMTEQLFYDFKATVCKSDGQVYVRRQDWFPVTARRWTNLPDQPLTLNMCKHVDYREFRALHKCEIDIAEKSVRHLKVLDYVREVPGIHVSKKLDWAFTDFFNCQFCATEYRIDFGVASSASSAATGGKIESENPTCSKDLYAIVATKWICLGNGGSRKTGAWRVYAGDRYGSGWQPADKGSIFEAFEGHNQEHNYRPVWTAELAKCWKSSGR